MSDAIILSSLSGKSQEKDDDNDDYDSAVPFDMLLDDHVGGCHVPGLKVAPEPVGSEDPLNYKGSHNKFQQVPAVFKFSPIVL